MDWAHSNQSPAPRQILISIYLQPLAIGVRELTLTVIFKYRFGERDGKSKESESGGKEEW